MKSYESSTATLRAILAHPLLQRDKIDETMDALDAANADAHEVDDAIQLGVGMAQSDAGVDDSELEAELQALVNEVQVEKTRERLHAQELSTPEHAPASPEDVAQASDREKVPVTQ